MNEIYKIVEDLNDTKFDGREDIWFEYTRSGFVDSVSLFFMGENSTVKMELWNSESWHQKYREETDDYEPLEKTLKREIKNNLKALTKIFKIAQ